MPEREKIEEPASVSEDDLEGMGRQIRSYEQQLKQYLDKVQPSVDLYNFAIEKEGDAVTIEFGLRATLRPRRKPRISDL
jgi:hypothetical protein